jgi:hypothetical protein
MLPLEIWTEIFGELLYEPALVNPSPFYSGCNPHTALIEWYDETRLQQVERQRRLLRLVSHTWKAIADRMIHQFYQLSRGKAFYLADQKFLHASRIHLGVRQEICACHGSCACDFRNYSGLGIQPQDFGHVEQILQDAPTEFQLPLKTLMIPYYWWDKMVGLYGDKPIASRLSRLSALLLAGANLGRSIPSICPKLTFLSISLQGLHFTDSSHFGLDFLHITGLVICMWGSGDFQAFASWNLPKLQHLSITYGSRDPSDQLREFFKTERSSLSSFALRPFSSSIFQYTGNSHHLPPEIWSGAPNLLYLGLASFGMDTIKVPPSIHPLRTLAFLQLNPYKFPRAVLGSILSEWNNIKVVADVHRWEDLPSSRSKAFNDPNHIHFGAVCEYCLILANSICSQYGVRYEDRYGRSLEEFTGL